MAARAVAPRSSSSGAKRISERMIARLPEPCGSAVRLGFGGEVVRRCRTVRPGARRSKFPCPSAHDQPASVRRHRAVPRQTGRRGADDRRVRLPGADPRAVEAGAGGGLEPLGFPYRSRDECAKLICHDVTIDCGSAPASIGRGVGAWAECAGRGRGGGSTGRWLGLGCGVDRVGAGLFRFRRAPVV